ncbi:BQ5605_C022g09491 [Microbotryum silenes-dioicae]|uniref:Glycine cleavage system H protein n=1 Tax=Microbotryum silenes-dioicae TaxID=796604 RepID=A0A2X0MKT9_9BASI|nr:BQ5605_C022g09491 [Microbotryum silenes-dioicae]
MLATSMLRSTLLRSIVRSSSIGAGFAQRHMAVRTVVTTRYTIEHEWIRFDSSSSIGTIGITDYAQKSLGDVVYVELPTPETQVEKGEQIGAVESVKAASDIYAPVSGQIEEVNDALGDEPGLLNKSAHDEGWLAKIKLSNPSEFEQLLNDDAYKAFCAGSGDAH